MDIKRTTYTWRCRNRTLTLGERMLVMGIVNVTPDSFSDGGCFFDPNRAVAHALELIAQGADIIDIGGESTRPGSDSVPVEEEIRRTVEVIERIRAQSDVLLSIDTMKAAVAERAIAAGADIINDVSAFTADSAMAATAARTGVGVVLMHMLGRPKTMQSDPVYDDVTVDVGNYLLERMRAAERHGVAREQIVIDPGLGFGKTVEHNLQLLRDLPMLIECCQRPLLIGASRKSFIGRVTGREQPLDRGGGSLAVAAWAVLHGAHILRVHDVFDSCDMGRVLDKLCAGDY